MGLQYRVSLWGRIPRWGSRSTSASRRDGSTTFPSAAPAVSWRCVAQRDNALSIPHAMMKKKLTLDEYMSARPIADPIHLFDCVMPCAGAEAFVVCREDVAKSLNLPRVRILSTIERHNAFPSDPIQ